MDGSLGWSSSVDGVSGGDEFGDAKQKDAWRLRYASGLGESCGVLAKRAAMGAPMPVIILVEPFLSANMGMVSRVMLNFGMYDLRIVAPVCDHLIE